MASRKVRVTGTQQGRLPVCLLLRLLQLWAVLKSGMVPVFSFPKIALPKVFCASI